MDPRSRIVCTIDQIFERPMSRAERRTELVAVRVDLEDAPVVVGNLNLLRAVLASIPVCYRLEIVEDVVLCKDGELDVVGGDVEEGGVGVEDLAEDLLCEGGKTAARDVYKGEGDGE